MEWISDLDSSDSIPRLVRMLMLSPIDVVAERAMLPVNESVRVCVNRGARLFEMSFGKMPCKAAVALSIIWSGSCSEMDDITFSGSW